MTVPQTRVPGFYVEFDSSRAFTGPSLLQYKILLIGSIVSGAIKTQGSISKVTSIEQARQYFGNGSQLALMYEWFLKGNKINEVNCLALNDNGAGVAATGTIVAGGSPTVDGVLNLYIMGKLITVAMTTSMTPTQMGDAIEAAVEADTNLPVNAANVAGTVTLTAKNAGESGNDIDVRINYDAGQLLPAGMTCTINGVGTKGYLSNGAANPDISVAITAMSDEWYQIIVSPYSDTTNLALMETEMEDRFGPMNQRDGMYIIPRKGSFSELTTWGSGRNSKSVSVMNAHNIPGWSLLVACAYAAQLAKEGQADPARPFQTLPLVGILPPEKGDQFSFTENNLLLFDGISTYYVDNGGIVRIQRAISQYQTNVLGADDISYLDVNSPLTLMYLRYDFRNRLLTKYPRAKLANDGVKIGAGQQVMTPKQGKAEAVSIFRSWMELGLVEGIDQFIDDLIVERDTQDVNRLNFILSPDLMNQFRVGAVTMQFLLQSN